MRATLPAATLLLAPLTALAEAPPFPAPSITEVLFNVPNNDDADANKDGTRHHAADEFVELLNHHDKPINLKGFTITSRLTTFDADTKRGIRFTFPSLELPPGAVVVLFNGCDASIPGPVGNAKRAPKDPNPHFDDAFVFSLENESPNNAFANAADFVLLSDPAENPIDAVVWGNPSPAPPDAAPRIAEVPKNPRGSVQRTAPDRDPQPHRKIDTEIFSPGRIPRPEHAGATDDARP